MSAFYTTMWELIDTIKSTLVDESGTGERLESIKTFKRGVLTKQPVFPAIFVIPREETIGARFSGLTYDVNRAVDIHVYTEKIPFQTAATDSMALADSISDILHENYTLARSGTEKSFDLTKEAATFGEDPPFRSKGIQHVVLPIVVTSREDRPVRTVNATWAKTAATDVLDLVSAALQADATVSAEVNFWTKQTIEPIPRFPAISVAVEEDQYNYRLTGLENIDRPVSVILWSHLTNSVTSLQTHLGIVEDIKDVLQANFQWPSGGVAACWNSRVETITYGSAVQGERTYLYATEIKMITQNHRFRNEPLQDSDTVAFSGVSISVTADEGDDSNQGSLKVSGTFTTDLPSECALHSVFTYDVDLGSYTQSGWWDWPFIDNSESGYTTAHTMDSGGITPLPAADVTYGAGQSTPPTYAHSGDPNLYVTLTARDKNFGNITKDELGQLTDSVEYPRIVNQTSSFIQDSSETSPTGSFRALYNAQYQDGSPMPTNGWVILNTDAFAPWMGIDGATGAHYLIPGNIRDGVDLLYPYTSGNFVPQNEYPNMASDHTGFGYYVTVYPLWAGTYYFWALGTNAFGLTGVAPNHGKVDIQIRQGGGL